MNKINYKIEFLSDWAIFSGVNAGGIDNRLLTDEHGFPYIPGKSLKGVFREAFEIVKDILELSSDEKKASLSLFGKPKEKDPLNTSESENSSESISTNESASTSESENSSESISTNESASTSESENSSESVSTSESTNTNEFIIPESSLVFSNAEISDKLKKELLNLSIIDRKFILNENTVVVPRIEIDSDVRMAKDKSLAFLEFGRKGSLFFFSISKNDETGETDFTELELKIINYCKDYVKRIGAMRTRGKGLCKITEITEAKNEI